LQLALVRGQAQDRVERRGLARTVGADEAEDAALLDPQVDPVQGHGCAVGLAQAACLDAGHRFSAPLPGPGAWPARRRRPSAVPPAPGRAAGSWRARAATPRP